MEKQAESTRRPPRQVTSVCHGRLLDRAYSCWAWGRMGNRFTWSGGKCNSLVRYRVGGNEGGTRAVRRIQFLRVVSPKCVRYARSNRAVRPSLRTHQHGNRRDQSHGLSTEWRRSLRVNLTSAAATVMNPSEFLVAVSHSFAKWAASMLPPDTETIPLMFCRCVV